MVKSTNDAACPTITAVAAIDRQRRSGTTSSTPPTGPQKPGFGLWDVESIHVGLLIRNIGSPLIARICNDSYRGP